MPLAIQNQGNSNNDGNAEHPQHVQMKLEGREVVRRHDMLAKLGFNS